MRNGGSPFLAIYTRDTPLPPLRLNEELIHFTRRQHPVFYPVKL